jgi:hypothetical protein
MLAFFIADTSVNKVISKNIYKIETVFNLPDGNKVRSSEAPAALVPQLMKNEYVQNIGQMKRVNLTALHKEKEVKAVEVFAMNDSAQSMLQLIPEHMEPVKDSSVYLSKNFASQISKEPSSLVGETLKLGNMGIFKIEKVIEIDKSLSLAPDVIVSFDAIFSLDIQKSYGDWYDTHLHLFIELIAPEKLDLNEVVQMNAPQIPGAPFTPESFIHLTKRNIANLHYDMEFPDAIGFSFSKSTLYLVYGVCLFSFILGWIGFVNSITSLQVSKMERTKTLLSIGGSRNQIILDALFDSKITVFIAAILSIVFFHFVLATFSQEFVLLTVVNSKGLYSISTFIVAALILVFVSTISIVVTRVVSLQQKGSISRSASLKSIWLTQFAMFVQMLITSLIIFVSVGITFELFSSKKADFGYVLEDIHYSKLGGVGDKRATALRDAINAKHGNLSEVSSWQPFDKSANYITLTTSQQSVEEKLTPINYFYAGEMFSEVLGLTEIKSKHYVLGANSTYSDEKVRVIVTKEFVNLFENIGLEQILDYPFYADFGDGEKEIEIIKVVSNFYLGKAKTSFDPVIIVIDEKKAKSLLLNTNTDLIDNLRITNQLDTISALKGLQAEFSDLTRLVFYLLCIVILNILLISFNTIANALIDVEKHSDSLLIMKQLGADLFSIFSFVFKKNIYVYVLSAFAGVFSGYIAIEKELFSIEGITFNAAHYSLSALVVALLFLLLTILCFAVVSQKYLAEE